jgi:LmbE family N-acetylglucosaminyl deacetylase
MENAKLMLMRWQEMLGLSFLGKEQKLKILCLGAHPDDIEVGAGGTILRLTEEMAETEFRWVVFSGDAARSDEARKGADAFLKKVKMKKIDICQFRDSYFPFVGAQIKDHFGKLKTEFPPDLIFTHYRGDAHQDHRLISELTWNAFRDHFILEYEIPKYDGDFGTPNLYFHLRESFVQKKTSYLLKIFETQKQKQWFNEETFRSMMRIRGVESNSPTKYAEAFYCRKIVF